MLDPPASAFLYTGKTNPTFPVKMLAYLLAGRLVQRCTLKPYKTKIHINYV
jgi:hypothetical protein